MPTKTEKLEHTERQFRRALSTDAPTLADEFTAHVQKQGIAQAINWHASEYIRDEHTHYLIARTLARTELYRSQYPNRPPTTCFEEALVAEVESVRRAVLWYRGPSSTSAATNLVSEEEHVAALEFLRRYGTDAEREA